MENLEEEKSIMRLERVNKGFGSKIEVLGELSSKFESTVSEMILEVEQLKDYKLNLQESLSKVIEAKIKETVPSISVLIAQHLEQHVAKVSKENLDAANKLTRDIDNSMFQATQMIEKASRSVSCRKMGWVAAICVSSFITAFGIQYFYPRYVSYHFTADMINSVLLGDALRDIWHGLPTKQQARLLKAYDNRLKKRFKVSG